MLKAPLRRPTDRKQYVQRTPAMAIGLTNHIFSPAELLRTLYFQRGWEIISCDYLARHRYILNLIHIS